MSQNDKSDQQEKEKIQEQELFQKINRETAKISWKELEPHYTSGALVYVEPSQDIVKVAIEFNRDNKTQVEKWLTAGTICRVSEEQAKSWIESNQVFWASVIVPWILIQPVK